MSKKIGILILSDLHFSNELLNDGKKAHLQDKYFKRKLIKYLEELAGKKESTKKFEYKYLIIVGDSSERGLKKEFEEAAGFLEDLCKKLQIDKKNVMIIPGNHDFSWSRFEVYIEEHQDTIKGFNHGEYNDIKFKEYSDYFNRFFNDVEGKQKFDGKTVITDTLYIRECGLLFIGVNSAYGDTFRNEDHKGYIDPELLENELRVLHEHIKYKKAVVVMHHPMGYSHLSKFTDFDSKELKDIFDDYKIKSFIAGDVHTNEGDESRRNGEYNICGTIGAKGNGVNPSFMLMVSDGEETIKKFDISLHQYTSDYNSEYWQHQSQNPYVNTSLVIEQLEGAKGISETVNEFSAQTEKTPLDSYKPQSHVLKDLSEFNVSAILNRSTIFFTNAIRYNKLLISGHFHWCEDGKSLTYLITKFFYEDCNNLERLAVSVLSKIKEQKMNPELVIGYEMNGSIIGSLIATDLLVGFSYITGGYRNYTKTEADLPKGEYSEVLVIIDFLYTDKLVKILEEKIKEAYPSMKELNIISVFKGTLGKKTTSYKLAKVHHLYEVPMLNCNKKIQECPIYNNKLAEVTKLYVKENKNKY